MMFGGSEWIIIGLVIVMFFGAKHIPKLARGIGQGIKEFKNVRNDIKAEIEVEQQEIRDSFEYKSKKKAKPNSKDE